MKNIKFDGKVIMLMHICWIEVGEIDGMNQVTLHLSDGSAHSEPLDQARPKFDALGL